MKKLILVVVSFLLTVLTVSAQNSDSICNAMNERAKSFTNEKSWPSNYETYLNQLVLLGDSMEKICGHKPKIGGWGPFTDAYEGLSSYSEIGKQRVREQENAAKERSRLNPQTSEEFTDQARAYKDSGMYAKAIKSYKQAYKVAKTDEDKFGAYMSQIEMIDEKYLPDSAVHMWQRCSVNGYSCRIKQEIGQLYFYYGKYEKALASFKAALAADPDPLTRNNICKAISDTYYKLGDIANGRKYYAMSQ